MVAGLLPTQFYVTFDNFLTVGKCRLAWRYQDDIGVVFERWLDIPQVCNQTHFSAKITRDRSSLITRKSCHPDRHEHSVGNSPTGHPVATLGALQTSGAYCRTNRYHAGAWQCVGSYCGYFLAASSAACVLPAAAHESAVPHSHQLPPVSITAPQATPPNRAARPKPSQNRGARSRTAVRVEPAGHCGRQRRHARHFIRWRRCATTHRRQRRAHQRRGGECRALLAARRGA